MTIERARVLAQPKPWGIGDLGPWSDHRHEQALIGELSYERADASSAASSLLLKLLFTSAPLSIQVHPDDSYARSIGLPNGKTEAWYVLSAAPGAQIALGLKQPVTQPQARRAIDDGTILELVAWRPVKTHDVISIPAGTIHAIGAGIAIAEIQQRSDVTFRLYDHGRARPLDIQGGLAVAKLGPAEVTVPPKRLTKERQLLVANSYFVFERIELAAGTSWCLNAERETWLFVVSGSLDAGSFILARGEAVLAQSERVEIRAGRMGVECLVAYSGRGGPIPLLLQPISPPNTSKQRPPGKRLPPVASVRTTL